jgi:hypothetical protein
VSHSGRLRVRFRVVQLERRKWDVLGNKDFASPVNVNKSSFEPKHKGPGISCSIAGLLWKGGP